jgi:hypothetical protein
VYVSLWRVHTAKKTTPHQDFSRIQERETMSNELTVVENTSFMPVMDIKQAVARRGAIVGFVQQIMVDGTDFGKIPGTDKPTLLKPGAEKLTTFFGMSPVFVSERIVENFGDDGSEPLFFYRYRCELYRQGNLMGTGIGSCNSREAKYRYRNTERVCPDCGKPAITKSKFPPRNAPNATPGWYCYAKKGGCGNEFAHNDPRITEQITGKVPNPDVADLVNTIDKMAQKRALIAATLIAVNASEFFTQDVEDMPGFVDGEVAAPKQAAPAPKPVVTQVTDAPVIDIGTARKAFHAQGVSVFGKDWGNARPWLIGRFTRKMTPNNFRESTNELTAQELNTLRSALVERADFYLAEYGREFAERDEAAGEAAAAGMAGEEMNPNPFEMEAAAA